MSEAEKLPPCPSGCDPRGLERVQHTASVTITCHVCGLRAPESTWNRLAAASTDRPPRCPICGSTNAEDDHGDPSLKRCRDCGTLFPWATLHPLYLAAQSALAYFRQGVDSENYPPGLVVGELQEAVDGYRAGRKQAREIAAYGVEAIVKALYWKPEDKQIADGLNLAAQRIRAGIDWPPALVAPSTSAETGQAQAMKAAMLSRLWAIQSERVADEAPEETMTIDALLSTIAADLGRVQVPPASAEEKCAGCGHRDALDPNGECMHVERDAGGSLVYCHHRCSRPAPPSAKSAFEEWFNREDGGDREQLERCWSAAKGEAR